MPLRINATRRQGTTRSRAPVRRGTNIRNRIRYKRPTARNQQRQLRTVARMALNNARILNRNKTYCDWHMYATADGGMPAQLRVPLMTPSNSGGAGTVANEWTATMRQNIDVVTQQRTFIPRIEFNYHLDTSSVVNEVYTTMFLVTLRPQFADWDGVNLTANQQWCSQGANQAVYLNPGCFKVHWTRFFVTYPANSLTGDTTAGGDPIVAPTGDPSDQYRRGRVTLKLATSLRAPINQTWKDLVIEQLPPSQRLYLLCFFNSDNSGATRWNLEWGVRLTTINSD